MFLRPNLQASKYFIHFQKIHTWIKPEGFDTGIKIYNCTTRKKEPLVIKNKQVITWYTCGPTVYDSSHIGHASCYIKLDVIQRILRDYFKYNIITVMNITDIDDKIIKKANQMKRNYEEVAKMYEKEFFVNLKELGVAKPNVVLRVTENMNIVIDFIKQIESKGMAYQADDSSVYFAVKDNNYGKLQKISDEARQQSKSNLKKNNMDFALWKSNKEGEPYWHSPWGTGRPGWHIECSALASYALGR